MRATRLLSSIALAPLLVGCTATHKYLEPELHRVYENARYLGIVVQDEVFLQEFHETMGATTGPDGIAVPTHGVAEDREPVEPLRSVCADLDFRAVLERELGAAARASPWLVPQEVRCTADESEDVRTAKAPTLVLRTSYFLAREGAVLVVSTEAKLYITSTYAPDYRGEFQFHSEPVLGAERERHLVGKGRPDSESRREEERFEAWAANDGAAFRAAVAEGIRDTLEMLRLDLLDEPASPDAESGADIVAFSEADLVRGRELRRDGSRVLLRVDDPNQGEGNGDLWSMPACLPTGDMFSELFATCHHPYELTQDCAWFLGVSPRREIDIDGLELHVAGSEKGDVILVAGSGIPGLVAVIEVLERAGVRIDALRRMTGNGLGWYYFLLLDSDGYSVLKGFTVS